MANLNILVIEGGIRKQKASNTQTVDFTSIRIGASNLAILETSGEFDFSAKKLTNLAAGVNPSDAVRFDQIPSISGKMNTNLSNSAPTTGSLIPLTDLVGKLGGSQFDPQGLDLRWKSVAAGSAWFSSLASNAITADNTIDIGSYLRLDGNIATTPVGVGNTIGLRANSNRDLVMWTSSEPANETRFVSIQTGNSGVAGSGKILLQTGTAAGTRGKVEIIAPLMIVDGTQASGRVLTSDASGNAIWAAAPADATKLPLAGGTMTGAIAMGTNKITGLGDPTALQDAATKKYVDDQDAFKLALAGGTMSGNIAMGNNMVSGLGAPVSANDAVRKAYVDAIASGALWYNPINDPDLIDDSLLVQPGSPVNGDVYIAAATAGDWVTGHAYYSLDSGATWVDLLGRAVIAGDRFGVSMESATTGAGGLASKDNQLATIVSPTPGAITYTFEVPTLSKAVYVSEPNSTHTGHQYNYNGSAWVEFGGLSAVTAGIGLSYSGNVLSVNLGAGIMQLPSDEVGIDVHTSGGLMTTVDNSTSSTLTNAQLALKLADTSLSKSGSGVKANLDEDTLTLDTTVKVKHSRSLTNDNGSAITTGQVAYIKSNGNVDLAIASTANLDSIWLGVVKDASIASAAAGLVVVRPGAIISGLSGLTPGKKQYLSRATAGAMVEVLTGFVTGEHVYAVGYAISASEMVYQPQFEYVF